MIALERWQRSPFQTAVATFLIFPCELTFISINYGIVAPTRGV
jgi:hypothetical protein